MICASALYEDLRKVGNFMKISKMVGINSEFLEGHPKEKMWQWH